MCKKPIDTTGPSPELIAAAPEMLEALKDVFQAINIQNNSRDVRIQLTTDFIEAVIRKAEGDYESL